MSRRIIELRENVSEQRSRFGASHSETIRALEELADALELEGEFEAAVSAREELVAAIGDSQGSDDEEILRAQVRLGEALRKAGQFDGAAVVQRSVLTEAIRLFGTASEFSAVAMNNLGLTLRSLGQAAEAYDLGYQSTDILRRSGDEGNERLQVALLALADTCTELGRPGEALELHREVQGIYESQYGPESPQKLSVLVHVVLDLLAMGNVSEAVAIAENSVKISRQALGSTHPLFLHWVDFASSIKRAIDRGEV